MADRFYRMDLGAWFPDRVTERSVQSWWGNGWLWGLMLPVLVVSGCTEWTIPPCEGTPFKTPCVGPCTIPVEPVGPAYTQATMPLAVVIQDQNGTLHCQQIKP
ncbi:MAG: hypothetical protein KGJ82_06080 [Nitrospirota bacterium]|nr:hypothetical protein [Nitrospirota bacterium]